MEFIETKAYSRSADTYLSEGEQRELHLRLRSNPLLGIVIRGTGGLRKIRVSSGGKGKRGGARVIYFYRDRQQVILLLVVYSKTAQDALTAQQQRFLRALVEKEFS